MADLFSTIITLMIVSPSLTIFFIYWFYIRVGKIKLVITAAYGDMIRIIHVKNRFSIKNDSYDYDNRKYIVDLTKSILDKNNKPILYYDKNNPNPMTFKTIGKEDSSMLHKVITNESASRLLHSYKDKVYLIIIIVLIAGIIGVAGYGIYTVNMQNQKIIELTTKIIESQKGVIR